MLGRTGLARTFQAVRLFRDMTVLENLEVGRRRRRPQPRGPRGSAAESILVLDALRGEGHVRAETLPYGDERRVGIGRALATAPRFAFLDEPAAGMTDAECDDLMALIARDPGANSAAGCC